MPASPAPPSPCAADDPLVWLAPSPLLDLQDPRLRLRVRALTQLCKTPREKALVLYGLVKRIPFARGFHLRPRTAREVLDGLRADARAKATLLVALLRIADIPARMRFVVLRSDLVRGLAGPTCHPCRPLLECWLQGRWQQTDTYIFDARYMAAARERLRQRGWAQGYGIGLEGQGLWDGEHDAYVAGPAAQHQALLLQDLGAWDDPLHFQAAGWRRGGWRRLQWDLVAPWMDRQIRRVRPVEPAEAPPAARS